MFLFQMFIFCVLYNFTLIWTLKCFINISFTLIIEFFGTALNFVSLQAPLLPHCCASPQRPIGVNYFELFGRPRPRLRKIIRMGSLIILPGHFVNHPINFSQVHKSRDPLSDQPNLIWPFLLLSPGNFLTCLYFFPPASLLCFTHWHNHLGSLRALVEVVLMRLPVHWETTLVIKYPHSVSSIISEGNSQLIFLML